MKLKSLILLVPVIILTQLMIAQPYGKEWDILTSPTDKTLRSLYFTDSTTGWASGSNGTIIHTTDGGNFWTIQSSNVSTFIHKIFFLNSNLGWALTIKESPPFGTTILKTTNGGTNWIVEDFPVINSIIYTIFFFDSANGFIGGRGLSSAPGNIAYTQNAGNTWLNPEIDSNMVYNFPVYEFNFYNRQFGYASGGRIDLAGVIWKTTNYGMNWTAIGISPDEVFDVFVFDSLNAITLSGDPEGFFGVVNIKTTDAGTNWIYDSLSITGLSFTIDFRTYNEGWSASAEKFLFTSDRGVSWAEKEINSGVKIWDLQFLDARTGYAVGDSGVILKLDPLAVNVEQEIILLNDFALYQNYPNPFNSTTKIKYTLPSNINSEMSNVSIKVFDLIGREIAVLIDEETTGGTYKIEFSAEKGLPSGIYFYQLRAGEFNQTKKMVYLK